MSLFKKIFSEQDNLSQQEIKDYLSGDSGSEYITEKKSLSNDLNSDALEGFVSNKSRLSEIEILKKAAHKSIFKKNYFTPILISIAIVASITYLVIKQKHIEQARNISTKSMTENIQTIEKTKLAIINKNLKQEINNVIEENNKVDEIIRQTEYIPLILSKKVLKLDANIETEAEIEQIKNHINFGVKYIADLKVVDYSKIKRSNNLSTNSIDIWNVEPSFSNYEEQDLSNNSTIRNIEYTYFDFLESGLKQFNKEEYFSAIESFELILQQYDNDLNAQFYSGLSYYYIGDYNKAIKYFNKVINDNINVFYEEGLWFKALSYRKTNQEKANKLFKQIVKKGGFYSKKAKKEVN